jgi:hypothetical protein
MNITQINSLPENQHFAKQLTIILPGAGNLSQNARSENDPAPGIKQGVMKTKILNTKFFLTFTP